MAHELNTDLLRDFRLCRGSLGLKLSNPAASAESSGGRSCSTADHSPATRTVQTPDSRHPGINGRQDSQVKGEAGSRLGEELRVILWLPDSRGNFYLTWAERRLQKEYRHHYRRRTWDEEQRSPDNSDYFCTPKSFPCFTKVACRAIGPMPTDPALPQFTKCQKVSANSRGRYADTLISVTSRFQVFLRHNLHLESGVDIPTVSRWLGHKDGGALAMRVYGHLRLEHSMSSAQRVQF